MRQATYSGLPKDEVAFCEAICGKPLNNAYLDIVHAEHELL
jgi:hypothetical protein